MDELRKFISQDIEERQLIREGMRRIKIRQIILILIGTLVTVMFALNYFELRKQIKKENQIIEMLNDVVSAGRILIESQGETIDSLKIADSISHK